MSDHLSGPRAEAEPIADITDFYAFPSPERPGWLVLVVNTLPLAPPSALFSDGLIYRFRLRPLTFNAHSLAVPFVAGGQELVFDCVFSGLFKGAMGQVAEQDGTCTLPTGEIVTFRVNDEGGGARHGVRAFAVCDGTRSSWMRRPR